MSKKKNKRGMVVRKLAKKPHAPAALRLFVCWYNAEEWARVRATAVDPDRFEESFHDWENMANMALSGLSNQGIVPIKFPIRAIDLEAWCAQRGKPNDASARAQFASEMGMSHSVASSAGVGNS